MTAQTYHGAGRWIVALYQRVSWWCLSVPIFIKILGICTVIAWLFGVVILLNTRATLPRVLSPLIEQRMRPTALWLAHSLDSTLAVSGQAGLDKFFEQAGGIMPGLRYFTIYDRTGGVLAQAPRGGDPQCPRIKARPTADAADCLVQSAPTEAGIFYALTCTLPKIPGATVQFGVLDDTVGREVSRFTRSIVITFLFCVFVGTVLTPLLTYFIVTRPIHNLEQAAGRIREGKFGPQARRFSDDDIGRLAGAFNQMSEGLERQRRTIEEKEKARLTLLDKLVEAQEEERKVISRELHDQIGQSLTALLLMVQRQGGSNGHAEELGVEIGEKLRGLIEEVRHLAWGMRPSILDDYGLDSALERYIQNTSRHYGVEIDYQYSPAGPAPERMPGRIEVTLYRVAQEALTNVISHSAATRASVVILQRRSQVTLLVEDNGQGFDPTELAPSTAASLGLTGMQERVSLLGGTCVIESAPGHGTTVRVQIPLEPARVVSGEL